MAKKMTTWEGIPMTSWESTKFALWLEKQDFWLNTFEKEYRLKIINDWLADFREKYGKNGEPVFLQ